MTTITDLCLGIPVDHRLQHYLLRAPHLAANLDRERGGHVDQLADFANSLHYAYGEPAIPLEEREFAQYLAAPATRGGLLCLLERPTKYQNYRAEPKAIIDESPTLKSVDDLLKVLSGGRYDITNTSTFDMMPFVPREKEGQAVRDTANNRENARATCFDMIGQKRPQVVLCCAGKMETLSLNMSMYSGAGVGKSFTNTETVNPDGSKSVLIKVFHPSYAVRYRPTESVFLHLLMLEFAQAFGQLRGDWVEQDWMDDLRREASKKASIKALSLDKPDDRDNAAWIFANRCIRDLRLELPRAIKDCYQYGRYCQTASALYDMILAKGICRRWLDISLVLAWFRKWELAGSRAFTYLSRALSSFIGDMGRWIQTQMLDSRGMQKELHTLLEEFATFHKRHAYDIDTPSSHLRILQALVNKFAHGLEILLLENMLPQRPSETIDRYQAIHRHNKQLIRRFPALQMIERVYPEEPCKIEDLFEDILSNGMSKLQV